MSLPDVHISRLNGQLGRVKPTIDNVFALVLSGLAVAGKIGLNEPKLLTSADDIETLGIDEATNKLAFDIITKFYSKAAAGTEMYLVLFAEATTLEDVCDKTGGPVKTVLDYADGRIRGVFVAKTFDEEYVPTIVTGLDEDVLLASAALQALCVERGTKNDSVFGVIPGYGFDIDATATLLDLNQRSDNQVSIIIAADDADGTPAIGSLAGWLALYSVHQNPARVASGSVAEAAWLLDGTTTKDARDKWEILHDKRYIFYRKIFQKSGFFFNDDPTACAIDDDYSSISWNRIINKAHVLAYGVLVEHLNDDVAIEPTTGKISPTLAADWEGDVENSIKRLMVNVGAISGVKCTIDLESDIVNDQVSAALQIVRNGQAKTINVSIGYAENL